MSEFSDAIGEAIRSQAKALDATIANYLFTRDIDTSLIINDASDVPDTLDMSALKAAIEALKPPVMIVHPKDHARWKEAADRAGYATMEEWMLSRGVRAEVLVSPNVWEGQVLISNPRLGEDFADS
jgi:hypothetical protein